MSTHRQSHLLCFFLAALLLAIAAGIAVYLIFVRDYQREALLDLGYQDDQITSLREVLSHDEIEPLLEHPHCPELSALLASPDFEPSRFYQYLDYLEGIETDFNLDHVVTLVNHDLHPAYTPTLAALMDESYFILSRLERYLGYSALHPDLSPGATVQAVNCDLDHTFYIDPLPTNIEDGELLLVNKIHQLSADYQPELIHIDAAFDNYGDNLATPATVAAFRTMAAAAATEGVNLRVNSAYRSAADQQAIYNDYLSSGGEAYAEEYAAHPGFSEHQTGLVLDLGVPLSEVIGLFEYTTAFDWLSQHAHEYGFILRYPADKESLTGYHYESWHYRYVGTEIATYIHDHDLTYEEYYAYFVAK